MSDAYILSREARSEDNPGVRLTVLVVNGLPVSFAEIAFLPRFSHS